MKKRASEMPEGRAGAARGASPGGRTRRGAALIEFVLVIPLLALVLGLTFFFGWSMRNQQRMRMAFRYAAWRRVHGVGETLPSPVSSREINRKFFGDAAAGVGVHFPRGPDQVLIDYVGEVSARSGRAGALAEELVLGHFPRGRGARGSAEFPTDVGLWQKFTGAIRASHVRDGVEWRRRQAGCGSAVRDMFLTTVDGAMSDVEAPGDSLAETVRGLYRSGW
jgi:hypothetical protein